ncbi:hypothetical protein AB5N19_10999 [Seiridium cardinale]|uniref:Stress response RCI peptide n=1 Tax=Seiridium cardinale TaxID=138064 RepID=A0ABR2X8W4_9PEZI
MCGSDIFLGLLAIIFPPLPVWIKCGICSADSFINILLCMLAYIPGLLHAWYIIAKVPDDYQYQHVPDTERGHHVIIIHGDNRQQHQQGHQIQRQPKPQQQNGMNYGTASSGGNASSSTAAQAGSSSRNEHEPAPPTYAEAVKGDHKVQTHE